MMDPLPPSSFAELHKGLSALPASDEVAIAAAAVREPQLTKPAGALGRLEQLVVWLAGWQGRHPPRADTVKAAVFAGNHGVAGLGVSAFPADVTAQMVANFQAGGAAINQLCKAFDVTLSVEALDLEIPTADFTTGPALDEAAFLAAFSRGMASVEDGLDVLCLGEMGIANTTAAAAVCAGLYGGGGAEWAGSGTGVTGDALANKVRVIDAGLVANRSALSNGVEVLRCLGGRELSAIAGAVYGARLRRVPVVLDGFVCTAAAAALEKVHPGALDHCVVGHISTEPGHALLLEYLGKTSLLNLDMRLGEASGAVLAVAVLKAACACHAGMATFAEAQVSGSGG
jgi:nicotinate-nucleotide--dimethylbenzimidazole phosphoribosyltransferase